MAGVLEMSQFKVWKTIKTEAARDYKTALRINGCMVGSYAEQILSKCYIAEKEAEIDLVVVMPRDLGLTEDTRYGKICERALSLGLLQPCSLVGPELRMQYADQPINEALLIGMEPLRPHSLLANSGQDPILFSVERYGGHLWLNGRGGNYDVALGVNRQIVFELPRN